MRAPDFRELVAREKLGLTDDWEPFHWEVIGDYALGDTLLKFGVPRVLLSGKRKGQKTWRDLKVTSSDQVRECVVSDAEYKARRARYEQETRKCSACGGEGQEFASWSAHDGTKTRPCARCLATGNAP